MKHLAVVACLLAAATAACSPGTTPGTAASKAPTAAGSTAPSATASAATSATASSAPATTATSSFKLDGVEQKIGDVSQTSKQPSAEGIKGLRWGFGPTRTGGVAQAADEWTVNVTLATKSKAPNDPALTVADIDYITIIATGIDPAAQVNAGGKLVELADKLTVAINSSKIDIHFKGDVTNPVGKKNNVVFDATGLRLK